MRLHAALERCVTRNSGFLCVTRLVSYFFWNHVVHIPCMSALLFQIWHMLRGTLGNDRRIGGCRERHMPFDQTYTGIVERHGLEPLTTKTCAQEL